MIDVQRNCRIVRRVKFECRGQEERYLTAAKPTTPALARRTHGAPALLPNRHHGRDAAIADVGTKSVLRSAVSSDFIDIAKCHWLKGASVCLSMVIWFLYI